MLAGAMAREKPVPAKRKGHISKTAAHSRFARERLVARVTCDRRWRWRGVGVYARYAKLGPVDRLPVCLNAGDVAAAIEGLGPFPRVIRMISDPWLSRWSGRFRVQIDARGRMVSVDRHAYSFGFDQLLPLQAKLKQLRFEPARHRGKAVPYDFAVNVSLSLAKGSRNRAGAPPAAR